MINDVAKQRRLHIKVGLRINPDYNMDNGKGLSSKFGVNEEAHKKGILQLKDYLGRVGAKKGYLIIFEFTKGKKDYTQKSEFVDGKEIFIVKV